MVNNYFKLLAKLESEYLKKHSTLSGSGKQTIQRLIMYVESGSWTKSEVTKLYCRNWNKSYDQLRCIFREEGFKDRGEVTIRSQISELSRNLCEMFGSCDEIYNAFWSAASREAGEMTKAHGEKFIVKLDFKLKALQGYKDESFMKRLAVNPYDFGIASFPEQNYQISDCTSELALLKTLSVEAIQTLYEGVDADKLAFLLQALNQPLLISERTEQKKKNGDSTYKVNRLSVNTAKVDIIQALNLVAPKKINPIGFKNSNVNEENLIVDGATEVAEKIESALSSENNSGVETVEELPFRFSTMSELCDKLLEKLNESSRITHSMDIRKNNIKHMKNVFNLFTIKGFSEYLTRFEQSEVNEAINAFRKG